MAAASILSRRLTNKLRFSHLNTLIPTNHNSLTPKITPQFVANFSTFENKFNSRDQNPNPNSFTFEKVRNFSTLESGDENDDSNSSNASREIETDDPKKLSVAKEARDEIEATMKTMELTRRSFFTASMINAGVAMWCFKTLDVETMKLLAAWSVGIPFLSAMAVQKYMRRMDRGDSGAATDSLQAVKNLNGVFDSLRLNSQAFYPVIAAFTVYKVYNGGA